MLTREDRMMIQELGRKGVYLKDIAHQLNVHPRTVRRALARGSPPSRRRQREKSVKLSPYIATVDRLLNDQVWNAVVIYRQIQAEE